MNPNNLQLSTDYPLDKILLIKTDSINLSLGQSYTSLHGLPFTPLLLLVWSDYSDFRVTYGIGDGVPSNNPSFPFLPEVFYARANSTSINIEFGNPGSTTTVYLRIYAFMPSDVSVSTMFTDSQADKFILNTDYNYTKLAREGVTNSSSTGLSTESVVHDLGYYPQISLWYEQSGYIYIMKYINLANTSYQANAATITTTTLTMIREQFPSAASRFHYRIYADEL